MSALKIASVLQKCHDQIKLYGFFKPGMDGYQALVVMQEQIDALRQHSTELGSGPDLGQLFENRFNCYADAEPQQVIMAMTKDRFVEVVGDLLQQELDAADAAQDDEEVALLKPNGADVAQPPAS